jgi:hypothetical protein
LRRKHVAEYNGGARAAQPCVDIDQGQTRTRVCPWLAYSKGD